jgi:hypothetical protein
MIIQGSFSDGSIFSALSSRKRVSPYCLCKYMIVSLRHRVQIEWQWSLSVVYSIIKWKIPPSLARVRGARPLTISWGFFGFFLFMYDIQHCFICRPSDSTGSEDAGIKPRTVATAALAVRRSNHSARSHPQIRLDLIHTRLDLIHSRLDLIHNSARSPPQLG